jgi:hypothetical protein
MVFLRMILMLVRSTEILLTVAATVLLLLAFSLYTVQKQPSVSNKEKPISKEYVLLQDPLLNQGSYSGLVEPSFEMRENVDFILTPALLVQECISEGQIITYPEE